ncbi:hypothetical protein KCU85_g130, partial [Aureobasidium melanogenum]
LGLMSRSNDRQNERSTLMELRIIVGDGIALSLCDRQQREKGHLVHRLRNKVGPEAVIHMFQNQRGDKPRRETFNSSPHSSTSGSTTTSRAVSLSRQAQNS